MDNKVIEVLDYMGEKLGIAVDWTADNVWPQVVEFMSRYRVYIIVDHGIHMIISIVLSVLIAAFLKTMFKGIKTKSRDNIWYDMHWESDGFLTVLITVILVFVAGFTITVAIDNMFDITKWAFIPEIQFFETLSKYMSSVK